MSPAFPLAGIVTGTLVGTSLIASVFSPKSAVLGLILSTLGLWGSLYYQGYRLQWAPSWWRGGLVLSVCYGALSSLWSVSPHDSLMLSLRLLGLFAAGSLLLGGVELFSKRDQEVFRTCLVLSIVLVFILLTIELQTDSKLYSLLASSEPRITRYNRILTTLSIIIWPLSRSLWGPHVTRFAAPALLVVTLNILGQFECDAALVGFILGLLMLPIALKVRPRLVTWMVCTPLVIGTLAAPLLPLHVISPEKMQVMAPAIRDFSYHHRLHIWHFTASKIMEKPLTGWGLDASRQPLFANARGGWTQPNPDTRPGQPAMMTVQDQRLLSIHPHNLPLQVWLELGLPGALLLCVMFVVLFTRLEQLFQERKDYAFAVSGIVSGLFSTFVSFGAWGGAWLASLWMAAAIFLALRQMRGDVNT
ncbi:MAG: O-antigen ligase family protein [Holosporales bacterium]